MIKLTIRKGRGEGVAVVVCVGGGIWKGLEESKMVVFMSWGSWKAGCCAYLSDLFHSDRQTAFVTNQVTFVSGLLKLDVITYSQFTMCLIFVFPTKYNTIMNLNKLNRRKRNKNIC